MVEWATDLRRNVLGWEDEQWEAFMCLLLNQELDQEPEHLAHWLGRLVMRKELARRSIIRQEATYCLLCKTGNETLNHLVFLCLETWKLWH
ncbi:Uncharacterized protein TCM_038264 [Theobroma cacao]|uniref:Reverse transcriptase zinc-binding domain-containing protein n=1 Tax=Theobroma cacao TaxID=3641 RepID=A0A061GP57_THECC|nr:Uncharacterized protein TCM_038264 [Theobroma cacao]